VIGRLVEWWTGKSRRAQLEREVMLERTAVERGVVQMASELRQHRGIERRQGAADRRRQRGNDRRA